MKTIQCDRCGQLVPYVPPYMNAISQNNDIPNIMITLMTKINPTLVEVDLCNHCKKELYDFIFNSSKS